MKKTIKQLEAEIARLEESSNRWYKEYKELKDEKERLTGDEIFSLKEENSNLKNQVSNLLEVIRWQINPETAKSPFMPDKSQRDEKPRY